MAKKKKAKVTEFLHPAVAAANAFNAIDGLDCISLQRAERVKDVVSCGSFSLDLILGGGFARGRFATLFGPEGCGKSTFLQELIVSCQLLGITVVHYDHESGSDPVYMSNMGIDLKHVASVPKMTKKGKVISHGKAVLTPDYLYCQPDFGEQTYRHMLQTLKYLPDVTEGPPKVVFLIDSLAAMASEEIDDETGESRISPNARMHSTFLQMVKPRLKKKGALLVAANQTRANIGGWGHLPKEYGSAALMFYPDVKIMFTRRKVEKDKGNLAVVPITARTTKNKLFIPFRIVEGIGVLLGRGIDRALDAAVFMESTGALETKSGRRRILYPKWETKALGWEEFRQYVENPKFRRFLAKQLKKDETYINYLSQDETANYFYDQDFGAVEAEPKTKAERKQLKEQIKAEAEEYKERRKKREKKGKGRGKKSTRKNRELEEE